MLLKIVVVVIVFVVVVLLAVARSQRSIRFSQAHKIDQVDLDLGERDGERRD